MQRDRPDAPGQQIQAGGADGSGRGKYLRAFGCRGREAVSYIDRCARSLDRFGGLLNFAAVTKPNCPAMHANPEASLPRRGAGPTRGREGAAGVILAGQANGPNGENAAAFGGNHEPVLSRDREAWRRIGEKGMEHSVRRPVRAMVQGQRDGRHLNPADGLIEFRAAGPAKTGPQLVSAALEQRNSHRQWRLQRYGT